jgi:hypothetical protein
VAQRAAVVRRQDAADGRFVRERRIERQPLSMPGERLIHLAQRRAGFDGGRQIAVLVGEDAIQPPHAQDRGGALRDAAPVALRAAAADDDRVTSLGRVPQRGGDFFGGCRLDDDAGGSRSRPCSVGHRSQIPQNDFRPRHMRSARPASSIGCRR